MDITTLTNVGLRIECRETELIWRKSVNSLISNGLGDLTDSELHIAYAKNTLNENQSKLAKYHFNAYENMQRAFIEKLNRVRLGKMKA